MTAADFRATLARLGLSQSALARVLQSLGDDRPWGTILRTVHELARADRSVPMPWSVVALLVLMKRSPEAWRPYLPTARHATYLPRPTIPQSALAPAPARV